MFHSPPPVVFAETGNTPTPTPTDVVTPTTLFFEFKIGPAQPSIPSPPQPSTSKSTVAMYYSLQIDSSDSF